MIIGCVGLGLNIISAAFVHGPSSLCSGILSFGITLFG